MQVKLLRPSVFHSVGDVMDVPDATALNWINQKPPRAERIAKADKKPAADPEPAKEAVAAALVPEAREQEHMTPGRAKAKKGPWSRAYSLELRP